MSQNEPRWIVLLTEEEPSEPLTLTELQARAQSGEIGPHSLALSAADPEGEPRPVAEIPALGDALFGGDLFGDLFGPGGDESAEPSPAATESSASTPPPSAPASTDTPSLEADGLAAPESSEAEAPASAEKEASVAVSAEASAAVDAPDAPAPTEAPAKAKLSTAAVNISSFAQEAASGGDDPFADLFSSSKETPEKASAPSAEAHREDKISAQPAEAESSPVKPTEPDHEALSRDAEAASSSEEVPVSAEDAEPSEEEALSGDAEAAASSEEVSPSPAEEDDAPGTAGDVAREAAMAAGGMLWAKSRQAALLAKIKKIESIDKPAALTRLGKAIFDAGISISGAHGLADEIETVRKNIQRHEGDTGLTALKGKPVVALHKTRLSGAELKLGEFYWNLMLAGDKVREELEAVADCDRRVEALEVERAAAGREAGEQVQEAKRATGHAMALWNQIRGKGQSGGGKEEPKA